MSRFIQGTARRPVLRMWHTKKAPHACTSNPASTRILPNLEYEHRVQGTLPKRSCCLLLLPRQLACFRGQQPWRWRGAAGQYDDPWDLVRAIITHNSIVRMHRAPDRWSKNLYIMCMYLCRCTSCTWVISMSRQSYWLVVSLQQKLLITACSTRSSTMAGQAIHSQW